MGALQPRVTRVPRTFVLLVWFRSVELFPGMFMFTTLNPAFVGTLAYKFQGVPTTLRNYKRVIEVWFDDEYKEFFYTVKMT